MYSPGKKKQPLTKDWSFKPHNKNLPLPVTQNPRNVDRFAADKGKSIASSTQFDREEEDLRRLKESGVFLDESLFEKQDRQVLVEKISHLEHELQDYQQTMGLLLVEKKDLVSTCEELREALNQARELLKREKIANSLALAEVEKREENLRKTFGNVEVQKLYDEHKAVLDLKRQEFELEMNQKRKAIDEEGEALKQKKKNHEKEWEVLDEKKSEIANMLNQLKVEKEMFEKLKSSNEERLKNENLIAQEYIQKELEALKMRKASFEASMERERLLSSEKARSERKKMLQDLEQQKRELELEMQNKLEKLEQASLEKEKVMKEKYEKFDVLLQKFKDQSKGDKMFLKKLEKCGNCGEVMNGFSLDVLKLLQEMRNTDGITDVTVELKEEFPEASLQKELKNIKPKRVIKPKRGANSVKEEAKDTKATVEKTQYATELKQPSGISDATLGSKELKVPEASLNLEPKNNQRKCDLKPRRGARRANTLDEEPEDAKVMAGELQESTEGKRPSGITDVAASNNKATKEDSVCVDKGSVAVAGKRPRSNPSEEENDKCEAQSVSFAAVGSKKRRQTVDRGSQIPTGTRYSLRQRKT